MRSPGRRRGFVFLRITHFSDRIRLKKCNDLAEFFVT
jgi:hypothetical protein